MSGGSGFDSGFSGDLGGLGYNQGFSRRRSGGSGGSPAAGVLYNNFDSYIINGTRELHGGTAGAGLPAFIGFLTRSNLTRTVVLNVTSTVTVQGFKFVRTPEASGNWTTTTFDDIDLVLTVNSGGSINGGALASKTFATNSKVRSATRTAVVNPMTVNTNRTEYDIYTVYDASPVTLTAGTYTAVYRGVNTQIGVAVFWTANIPIVTTDLIYPDPTNANNTTYHPVMQILSTAP